jgi:hypothetical protein
MAADPPTPRIFPLPQAATSAVARAVARNVPTASARAVTARAVAPVRVPALARGLARGGARRARASFAVCAAGKSVCGEWKGGREWGLVAGLISQVVGGKSALDPSSNLPSLGSNPVVFFDVEADGAPLGRIEMTVSACFGRLALTGGSALV